MWILILICVIAIIVCFCKIASDAPPSKTKEELLTERIKKSGERSQQILEEIQRDRDEEKKKSDERYKIVYNSYFEEFKDCTIEEIQMRINSMKDDADYWGFDKKVKYKVLKELERQRISEKCDEIVNIIQNELYTSYALEQFDELNYYIQFRQEIQDEQYFVKYKKFLNKQIDEKIYESIKDYTPGKLERFLNSSKNLELGDELLNFIHEKINAEPLLDKLLREKNNISSNIRKNRSKGNLEKVEEYEILLKEINRQIVSVKNNNSDVEKLELPDDIENLNKLKENIRIKISKAKNRLEYQSEKKLENPKPMPEGHLRTKIENRLSLLLQQKEEIEQKIKQII